MAGKLHEKQAGKEKSNASGFSLQLRYCSPLPNGALKPVRKMLMQNVSCVTAWKGKRVGKCNVMSRRYMLSGYRGLFTGWNSMFILVAIKYVTCEMKN